jgi:hypothetical protein
MTWHDALRVEIVHEFRQLSPTMWDAWDDLRSPRRDDEMQLAMQRAATKRKVSVLLAVGKVREARRIESQLRAWKRRRKKR